MDTLTERPWDLPNGASYSCCILSYARGHTHLEIEISNGDNTKYLIFEGVEYFSIPNVWKGADFMVAPQNECLKIIHWLQRYTDIPDEYLASKFRLFVLASFVPESSLPQVAILAQSAGLSDQKSDYALSKE
ncbi:MAG: hypothetical protein ABI947_30545 [Chloroflexota bacterium]